MNKVFNSKILLFGEYGIIKGSRGLAVPFDAFFGVLDFGDANHSLEEFISYVKRSSILKKELNIDKLESDYLHGLFFSSTIPQGFGLGSSGALCAAIFSEYSLNYSREQEFTKSTLGFIQELLSIMESFFHGTSSGLDPLICFLNKPLLIKSNDDINIIEEPVIKEMGDFYLLDSGIQRKTSPLVHQFLKDCSDEKYFSGIKKYMNLTNTIIDNLLSGQKENIHSNFSEISRLQYLYFEAMIPKKLKEVWLTGLESKDYYLKLCGAGGGGYFIVHTVKNKTPLNFNLIRL